MEYKFAELFSWSSGKAITPTKGDIPVYGSNGIIGYTDIPKYENKIILGRVGAYCGSVEYCKSAFNATDNTLITTCDETKIRYLFAYYLLKLYNLNSFAGGSAQPLITQGILKHLKCDIPDIQQQEKIEKLLVQYDKAISSYEERKANLANVLENIYKEWFVRSNNEDNKEVVRLGDICDLISRGVTPSYVDTGIEVINQKCIRNSSVNRKLCRYTDPNKKIRPDKFLRYGDILVNSTGTGTLGRTAIFHYSVEEITADGHVTIVRPTKDYLSAYIGFYLHDIEPQLENLGRGTTNQLELSAKDLKRIKITLPKDDRHLREFNKLADKCFKEQNKIDEAIEILIKQRDILIPRLLSKKIIL